MKKTPLLYKKYVQELEKIDKEIKNLKEKRKFFANYINIYKYRNGLTKPLNKNYNKTVKVTKLRLQNRNRWLEKVKILNKFFSIDTKTLKIDILKEYETNIKWVFLTRNEFII